MAINRLPRFGFTQNEFKQMTENMAKSMQAASLSITDLAKAAAKMGPLITSEKMAIMRGKKEIEENTKDKKYVILPNPDHKNTVLRKNKTDIIMPDHMRYKQPILQPNTVDWADPPLGRHFYLIPAEGDIVQVTRVLDSEKNEVPFMVRLYSDPVEVIILVPPLFTKEEVAFEPAHSKGKEMWYFDCEIDWDYQPKLTIKPGINSPPFTNADRQRFMDELTATKCELKGTIDLSGDKHVEIREFSGGVKFAYGGPIPPSNKTNKPLFTIPDKPWSAS